MAATIEVTGSLAVSLLWTGKETENRGPTGQYNTITDTGKINYSENFTTGTGAGQTEEFWHDVRILTSGGVEQFDLTSLTQTILGGSVTKTFSKIKTLVVENKSDDADIGISMTGSNTWGEPLAYPTGIIKIHKNSPFIIASYRDGWTVDATNKVFQIHDLDGSGVTYHIATIGN